MLLYKKLLLVTFGTTLVLITALPLALDLNNYLRLQKHLLPAAILDFIPPLIIFFEKKNQGTSYSYHGIAG